VKRLSAVVFLWAWSRGAPPARSGEIEVAGDAVVSAPAAPAVSAIPSALAAPALTAPAALGPAAAEQSAPRPAAVTAAAAAATPQAATAEAVPAAAAAAVDDNAAAPGAFGGLQGGAQGASKAEAAPGGGDASGALEIGRGAFDGSAKFHGTAPSAHVAAAPPAVDADAAQGVRLQARPKGGEGSAAPADARAPPAADTVETALAGAVARGGLDAAQARAWTKAVYRDGLLGLRNRVDLDEHLTPLVAQSRSLIVFKLDFLKEINDTFGHDAGNEALKKLAAIAARGVPEEALFRRSPTGFAIFTDAGPDESRRLAESDARLMAEALRGLVDSKIGASESALGRRVQGVDWGGTISVGVSAFDHAGTGEQSYARALAHAEDARIFAKDVGMGNRVAVADGDLRLMERLGLDESLAALADTRPSAAASLSAAAARTLADLEADHAADGRLQEPVPAMLARVADPDLRRRLFAAVYRDRLTGLLNRRWLFDHLPRLFRNGETKAYLSFDIDKFGALNAKIGEQKADLVLGQLGAVLSEAVEGQDASLLHLSGEEFAVLAGRGVADPAALGESIRRKVEAELGRRAADRGIVDPRTGETLKVTVSVGVAAVPEKEGAPEPILTLATAMSESMLQRAKTRGRNQVVADGAPVTASELMARLSRLIRIDDAIRKVVGAVIAPAGAVPSPTAFDNTYKTRAHILKMIGFSPWWRATRSPRADRLGDPGSRSGLVARVRGGDGRAYVVKIAPEPAAQNELILRGFVDAFEVFNESLAAPRAVAYREVVGPPIVVMPDVPNRHPYMDGRHLPLAQKAALAAFALTFGVTPDEGAFLDVDWSRTTLADFARARQETRLQGEDRRRWNAPWVSPYYHNDLADYRPALARWREAFARTSSRAEVAAILRRNGVSDARIASDLDLFERNLARLEGVLAGDVARANAEFERSAAAAGLGAEQTGALSDVNHAAHLSALGGAMRDVLRWLAGGAPPDAPFHVTPAEFAAFARSPDLLSRAARLKLAAAADAGRVHRRDGERLSERQALEAFDALALRARGAARR